MSRMNQQAGRGKRRHPRGPEYDAHGPAVKEALAEGLGDWAPKYPPGHPMAGKPMLFSARMRSQARRARMRAEEAQRDKNGNLARNDPAQAEPK